MHNPAEFAEKVASFLVWYYVTLAVMNGVAAYYLWQKTEPVTYFRLRTPGFTISFTNALLWTLVALVFVVFASMVAGGHLNSMPKMPADFRTWVNARTGPVIYSLGTTVLLAILY